MERFSGELRDGENVMRSLKTDETPILGASRSSITIRGCTWTWTGRPLRTWQKSRLRVKKGLTLIKNACKGDKAQLVGVAHILSLLRLSDCWQLQRLLRLP